MHQENMQDKRKMFKPALQEVNEIKSYSKLPSFEFFFADTANVLAHLKVWRKYTFSQARKIFDTCLIIFLMTLNILLIISEVLDAENSYDLSSFAGHINPLFLHCLGLFKWMHSIFYHDEIVDIVQCMEQCHTMCKKINMQDIGYTGYKFKLAKCHKTSVMFMRAWFFLAIGGVMQWCSNALIYDFYEEYYDGKIINSSAMRRLPYPGFFPWKIDSISQYIMNFAFQLMGGIGSAIGVAVYDVLTLTLMMYVCVQLEYLKETLMNETNVGKKYENYDTTNINNLESTLKHCISHHSQILICLNKLQSISSFPIFIQCLGIVLALCLISFEASTTKFNGDIESVMKTTMMIEYWSSIVIELFLYCYISSRLEELGMAVSQALYACQWEQFYAKSSINSKNQRLIVNTNRMIQLGMMRAQRPILITGGPFYVLGLPTFKSLVGLSISNALVLRQLSEIS